VFRADLVAVYELGRSGWHAGWLGHCWASLVLVVVAVGGREGGGGSW